MPTCKSFIRVNAVPVTECILAYQCNHTHHLLQLQICLSCYAYLENLRRYPRVAQTIYKSADDKIFYASSLKTYGLAPLAKYTKTHIFR